MHFVLQTPSLQHVARVKIVAHVWNQRDIRAQIVKLFNRQPCNAQSEESSEWEEIEEKVKSKVSALPLPKSFQAQLLKFVKPIGVEIIRYCRHYTEECYEFLFSDILLLNPVCWTMRGNVDYAKTAELMIKDERVHVVRRYEVACISCLEEKARELFPYISKNRRRKYIDRMIVDWREEHHHLIVYFTCTFNGRADQLRRYFKPMLWQGESIHTYLFKVMLGSGNGATLEYLFENLNQREKDQVLEEYLDRKHICVYMYSETFDLLFHLSRMSQEQREQMFQERTFFLLRSFLEWPYQSLFMETARRGLSLLNKDHFKNILGTITGYILRGHEYSQMFWECWELTPTEYEQHFLRDVSHLYRLIVTEKEEFISLVFMEAPLYQLFSLFNPMDGITQVFYNEIMRVLKNESFISDAALMECKALATLSSSNDKKDVGKRLRSQGVNLIVDRVMEKKN